MEYDRRFWCSSGGCGTEETNDDELGQDVSVESSELDDFESGSSSDEERVDTEDELREATDTLDVDPVALAEHFYVDDAGTHVDDPLGIDPKYALLGYGPIEKERTGDPYLDNQETKQTLIEDEMLDIDNWGGTLLYGLRQDGLIKNDPTSDKQRNVPFRITPKGGREFVEWLEGDD
ncbi:hypothetical protein [Halobaculum sp. MBLA0143]|uniref:hypothetical protein n=1 Tax=Halobaculum sp. MBLA0143 TaxID=3079933 RepID=UPI0035255108